MPGIKLNQAKHESIQKKRDAKEKADDCSRHAGEFSAPAVKTDAEIKDEACAENTKDRANSIEGKKRNPAAISKKVQRII